MWVTVFLTLSSYFNARHVRRLSHTSLFLLVVYECCEHVNQEAFSHWFAAAASLFVWPVEETGPWLEELLPFLSVLCVPCGTTYHGQWYLQRDLSAKVAGAPENLLWVSYNLCSQVTAL